MPPSRFLPLRLFHLPCESALILLTISHSNVCLKENRVLYFLWWSTHVSVSPANSQNHIFFSFVWWKAAAQRREICRSDESASSNFSCFVFFSQLSHVCFCLTSSLKPTPPSPPRPLLQCVTRGARCLVRENVPTYQKAPGFWVEAAQRRKRSSWIQWLRMEGWGQSCEERWLIPAAERRSLWKDAESSGFVLYFLPEISAALISSRCFRFALSLVGALLLMLPPRRPSQVMAALHNWMSPLCCFRRFTNIYYDIKWGGINCIDPFIRKSHLLE